MNFEKCESDLVRFEKGESLTRSEQVDLVEYLQQTPERVAEISDRQAVNGLLVLEQAQNNSERFVKAAQAKFAEYQEAALVIHDSSKSETSVGHSDPDNPVDAIPETAMQTSPVERHPNFLSLAKTAMVLAAGVLIGFGCALYFLTGEDSPIDSSRSAELVEKDVDLDRGLSESTKQPNDVEIPKLTFDEGASVPGPDNVSSFPPEGLAFGDDGTSDFESRDVVPERDAVDAPSIVFDDPRDRAEESLVPKAMAAPPRNPIADRATPVASEKDAVDLVPVVKARLPAFANVLSDDKAIWAGDVPQRRVGNQLFHLLKGNATIEFDNGTRLYAMAPAEFELLESSKLRLMDGKFGLETPRDEIPLRITSPLVGLVDPQNLRLNLILDGTQSIETFVSRGSVHQVPMGVVTPEKEKLSRTGFFRSLVKDHRHLEHVAMYGGRNKFRGELSRGKSTLQVKTPESFANVLKRIGNQIAFGNSLPDEQEWGELAQQMSDLPVGADGEDVDEVLARFLGPKNFAGFARKMGDVFPEGSSSFQGSLTINGVVKEFDSAEEFEKARQKAFGNRPGFANQIPKQFSLAPDMKLVPDSDQRPLMEFSPPQVFREMRKRMR